MHNFKNLNKKTLGLLCLLTCNTLISTPITPLTPPTPSTLTEKKDPIVLPEKLDVSVNQAVETELCVSMVLRRLLFAPNFVQGHKANEPVVAGFFDQEIEKSARCTEIKKMYADNSLPEAQKKLSTMEQESVENIEKDCKELNVYHRLAELAHQERLYNQKKSFKNGLLKYASDRGYILFLPLFDDII